MSTIRPVHAPAVAIASGGSARPAQPAGSSFAQRLSGAQAASAQAAAPASQVPGHSLDDGSRPLTPQELQEELRSVALQQGLMMGQRLLTMTGGAPSLDRE